MRGPVMTRGLSMRSLANWTRLALIALLPCALASGGLAHADAPQGGTVPPGWVWQGVWQDGRWNGQWVPGPGVAPQPMPGPGGYPPPVADPEMQRMIDRCRDTRHDGVGGAVIGGVAGGVIGNRLVPGNRVAGTLGGAAVGAIAGSAIERSHHRARDRDCQAFFNDHPEFAPGTPMVPGYGPMPYGAMGYPPAGYMMVPVITGPQAPCVETRTVTTEYVVDKRRRVFRARPHRKDKRVYTGS
jgi:hypothetical protein